MRKWHCSTAYHYLGVVTKAVLGATCIRFVNKAGSETGSDVEALSLFLHPHIMLHRRIKMETRHMSAQIICVAQQKGGAGKTTIVSNLAIAFLSQGKSVALLDTDPQGSLGKWLDIREQTLGEDEKLRFATATAYGISRAIRGVGNEADVILVDTPPKADSDVRWVLREADLVLVPVSASQADVWATHDILDLADRAGKPTNIVLNRVRAGTRVGEDVAKSVHELEAKQLNASLANRVVYAEALGSGLGVLEAKRSGSASDEVHALADEVSTMLDL